MRKRPKWLLRVFCCSVLCAASVAAYSSQELHAAFTLPGTLYVSPSALDRTEAGGGAAEVQSSGDERLEEALAKRRGSSATVELLGVPVRTVEVVTLSQRLVPGGMAAGIKLYLEGVLVVGTSPVSTAAGEVESPAKQAGIRMGDVILAVNGKEVEDSDHLGDLVNAAQGPVLLTVKREEVRRTVEVQPETDQPGGERRLGVWTRDSTSGVGTVTFYDPASGVFGALGHVISDVDTQTPLPLRMGELVGADILGITRGERGAPGELKGAFRQGARLGSVTENCAYGIYGRADEGFTNPLYPDGVEIAARAEVRLGKASILSTVDGEGVKEYDCEIIRLTGQSAPDVRGIVVEITDERLLSATGGIVQGMSGSPILQDGRLVGAVTHVFVNDPKKGYGVYIEWMLGVAAQQNALEAA